MHGSKDSKGSKGSKRSARKKKRRGSLSATQSSARLLEDLRAQRQRPEVQAMLAFRCEKRLFWSHFHIKRLSFCRDRLGTNTQEKLRANQNKSKMLL